jgi:hypothetical protein
MKLADLLGVRESAARIPVNERGPMLDGLVFGRQALQRFLTPTAWQALQSGEVDMSESVSESTNMLPIPRAWMGSTGGLCIHVAVGFIVRL